MYLTFIHLTRSATSRIFLVPIFAATFA